jgi:hypothetical protein
MKRDRVNFFIYILKTKIDKNNLVINKYSILKKNLYYFNIPVRVRIKK